MGIIVSLIYYILYILELLIFVRCIFSFLPFNNRFTEWIYMATEPILSPCRKLIGKFNYGLPVDFSPIIALLVLQLLQRLIFLL